MNSDKILDTAQYLYNLTKQEVKELTNTLRSYYGHINEAKKKQSYDPSNRDTIIPFVVVVPRISYEKHFKLIKLGTDSLKNSFFLNSGHFIDKFSAPAKPYVLINIDISERKNILGTIQSIQIGKKKEDQEGIKGPLTLDESLALIAQFPEVLRERARGIHVGGSHYHDGENPPPEKILSHEGDYYVHLYRLGEGSNSYLKIAREKEFFYDSHWINPMAWRITR